MSARYGTGGNNIPLVQQEEVICIAGNAIDRQPQNGGNGFGWQRDISYTLTTSDRHSVYARQRVDQFRDDEIASTESARAAQGRYRPCLPAVLYLGCGLPESHSPLNAFGV